jgi:ABC-type phosphate transport system substrate-binding protein
MTGLSARRLVTALAATSASALAFMLPGAATASAEVQIKGQGSTLQEFAQNETFIPRFNAKHEGEVLKYTGTGSGAGLEAWGNGGHKAEFNTWEYVGTDQPPNASQKTAIEKAAGGATVLSIPTLQAAVALIIHLPSGCTSVHSRAKKETGRLALNDATVEGIFKHTITKWSEIKDEGDELLPAGCEGTAAITRVVRKEGSGTTAIMKKFLYQINDEKVDGEKTWNNLAEENKNLNWPAETENLVRGEGSPGIVTTVAAEAGSIGYVNLANAYQGAFGKTGGVDGWAVVENKAGKKPTYANPEKPGGKIAKSHPKAYKEGTSNCAGTIYVNGVGAAFPPKTTEEAWNEVSSTTTEPNYPICGFTYDLSLKGFSSIEPSLQPTEEQVNVIKKYFTFMINEGAALFHENTDYEGLPTNSNPEKSVFAIAKAGVEKIAE